VLLTRVSGSFAGLAPTVAAFGRDEIARRARLLPPASGSLLMNRHPVSLSSPRRSVRLAAAGAAIGLLAGVLAVNTYAASGGGNKDEVVQQFLASTGEDADATAVVEFTDKGDDAMTLSVELEGLPAGDYDLYVTDLIVPKGTPITVDGEGHGEIEFATPQDGSKPPFNFPVVDQAVEIRQGATAFFTDTLSADGTGDVGDGDKTKSEVNFVNPNVLDTVTPGVDFDAKGSLKYEASKTKIKLTLKVDKLDPGTYMILVAGVPSGVLTTADSGPAEVDFQDPLASGKTLLTFNPLGQQVDIVTGTTTVLTAVLPAPNDDSGVKAPSSAKKAAKDLGKTKADSLQIKLLNSGVQFGAEGEATLTQTTTQLQVTVTVNDVTPGSYDLLIAGVSAGTFVAGAEGSGELQFSIPSDEGEAVKGQLMEVRLGADTVLESIVPTSVQAALGSFKKETFKENKVTVNLVNMGLDLDAIGTLAWKLKGNGDEEVVVDVKDLPEGTYVIKVNGTPSAASFVVSDKGKGKLTYATVAKGNKVLLDFEPVNAIVEIVDSVDQALLKAVIDVPGT